MLHQAITVSSGTDAHWVASKRHNRQDNDKRVSKHYGILQARSLQATIPGRPDGAERSRGPHEAGSKPGGRINGREELVINPSCDKCVRTAISAIVGLGAATAIGVPSGSPFHLQNLLMHRCSITQVASLQSIPQVISAGLGLELRSSSLFLETSKGL